jgi:hypothetical protein
VRSWSAEPADLADRDPLLRRALDGAPLTGDEHPAALAGAAAAAAALVLLLGGSGEPTIDEAVALWREFTGRSRGYGDSEPLLRAAFIDYLMKAPEDHRTDN